MERVLRREHEEPRHDVLPLPSGQSPAAPAPVAPTTVEVIWGPLVEHMAVGGMTVAEVRVLLRRPYNIPPHADALVNGDPVMPQHRLVAGDSLEFTRASGEKGCGG